MENEIEEINTTPEIEKVVSSNNHTLYIDNQSGLLKMIVSHDELQALCHMPWGANQKQPIPELTGITNSIYEKYEDKFDFIVFVLNKRDLELLEPLYMYDHIKQDWPDETVAARGYNVLIKNDIEKIAEIRDLSSYYGSNGELNSIVLLTDNRYVKDGMILHEIGHRWGMYFPSPVGDGPHMSITSLVSQMSYYMAFEAKDNYYVIKSKRNDQGYFSPILEYNTWELYVMGLASESELSDIEVLTDYIFTDEAQGIAEGIVVKYRADEIIEYFNFENDYNQRSQKEFTSLFVLLSDQEISDQDYEFFKRQVEWFCSNGPDDQEQVNFFEATLGQARMHAK